MKANKRAPATKRPEKSRRSQKAGETFGNEPPIEDPKPRRRPDRYEVDKDGR